MPIDFAGLRRPARTREAIIDPVELFYDLEVSDPAINDLWLAQGDALRKWHQNRHLKDVAIVLNTGAGKTLVGLLAAQSFVNETRGHVLYACSSIQLVEQTFSKAVGYGLRVATYTQGEFTDGDLYHGGVAPCLTTYHALFNGKSRFFRDSVDAVVFDDAHTAEHLLREQFTLRLRKATFPDLFPRVVSLFRSYFERVGRDVGYRDLVENDSADYWFVPPFALRERTAALNSLLLSARLCDYDETKFAWEYLKDRVDLCALFVSGREVAVTPPVVPVLTLPYFDGHIRRLYLSATLSAKDTFLRTFGRVPDKTIAPVTTAGECERMIIIPSIHPAAKGKSARDGGDPGIDAAKRMIRNYKALILVPSYRRAEVWADVAQTQGKDVASEVEDFKSASPPTKLLLVNRYDGIDLPGDTCRMMVIDDLPSSVGPLEGFLWERLGAAKLLQSTVASRVIQSLGRISRGMSDHGVVILTGENLIRWVLNPKNLAALPRFLRLQLELGIELSRSSNVSLEDLFESPSQCLSRDSGWVSYYSNAMKDHATPTGGDGDRQEATSDEEEALVLAKVGVDFGHLLWKREYDKAAKYLHDVKDKVFAISRNMGAWYLLWYGYCCHLLGDCYNAQQLYHKASRMTNCLPPPDLSNGSTDGLTFPTQVVRVAELLTDGPRIDPRFLERFDAALLALDASGSAYSQVEEALRTLGEYLGLGGSRPDHEFGTGPDVLWNSEDDGSALAMEVKTNKQTDSPYRKDELGQLRDHVQWVREHFPASTIIYPVFVGPVLPCSRDCSPDPEMVVVHMGQFKQLAKALRDALSDVAANAVPATLPRVIHEVFKQRRLLWPECYQAMAKHCLRDLRER